MLLFIGKQGTCIPLIQIALDFFASIFFCLQLHLPIHPSTPSTPLGSRDMGYTLVAPYVDMKSPLRIHCETLGSDSLECIWWSVGLVQNGPLKNLRDSLSSKNTFSKQSEQHRPSKEPMAPCWAAPCTTPGSSAQEITQEKKTDSLENSTIK